MIETRAVCLRFRMDCYKCITETLNYLLSTSLSHPQAPSVPKLPGPPQVTDDPNRLACAEAEKHVSTSYLLPLAGSLCSFSSLPSQLPVWLQDTTYAPVVWGSCGGWPVGCIRVIKIPNCIPHLWHKTNVSCTPHCLIKIQWRPFEDQQKLPMASHWDWNKNLRWYPFETQQKLHMALIRDSTKTSNGAHLTHKINQMAPIWGLTKMTLNGTNLRLNKASNGTHFYW